MFKIKRIHIEILLLTVFAALSLYISVSKSIWRDEAFSVLLIDHSVTDIVQISAEDFNPPFYYILLRVWMLIFGKGAVMLRSFSLFFTLITIALLFRIRSYIFEKLSLKKNWVMSGLYYGLILSSNSLLYFSAELRPYALQMLLLLLSSILAVRFLKFKNSDVFLWLGAVNILMVYTHTMGVLWVTVQMGLVGLYLLFQKDWSLFKRYLVMNLGFVVFAGPWILIMIHQKGRAAADFWITFDKQESLKQFIGVIVGVERIDELENYSQYLLLFKYAKYLIYLGAVYGLVKLKDSRIAILSFFGLLTVVYYYSYYLNPILYSRYVSLVTPLGLLGMFLGNAAIWCVIDKSVMLGLRSLFSKRKQERYSRMLARALMFGLGGSFIVMNLSLLPDLFDQLNRTDYFRLLGYSHLPIYTNEELDLMSCLYYSDQCMFVGDASQTLPYVGVSRFENIPVIESWDLIDNDRFLVDYKNYHQDEIFANLTDLGYALDDPEFLGDNTYIVEVWR